MKAVILLRTNPGSETSAYEHIQTVSAPGVKITEKLHVFGRVDGVIMCEAESLNGLGKLGEELRRGGVFHTETLISLAD